MIRGQGHWQWHGSLKHLAPLIQCLDWLRDSGGRFDFIGWMLGAVGSLGLRSLEWLRDSGTERSLLRRVRPDRRASLLERETRARA